MTYEPDFFENTQCSKCGSSYESTPFAYDTLEGEDVCSDCVASWFNAEDSSHDI